MLGWESPSPEDVVESDSKSCRRIKQIHSVIWFSLFLFSIGNISGQSLQVSFSIDLAIFVDEVSVA